MSDQINLAKQLVLRENGMKRANIKRAHMLNVCSNLEERKNSHEMKNISQEIDSVNCIDVDESGQFVLVGGSKSLSYIDTSRNTQHYISYKNVQNTWKYQPKIQVGRWVDKRTDMFLVGQGKRILLWDTYRMKPLEIFQYNQEIMDMAVAEDRGLVAITRARENIFLIDYKTGYRTHELREPDGSLTCAWSPTVNHLIAAGSVNGVVKLWDVRSSRSSLATLKENLQDLSTNSIPVNGVTFTSDGRRILSACNGIMTCWDSNFHNNLNIKYEPFSGQTTKPLFFHAGTFGNLSCIFVPCHYNVIVMDVKTGHTINRIRDHYLLVNSVAFDDNNVSLYTGGMDGFVYQYWAPSTTVRHVSNDL